MTVPKVWKGIRPWERHSLVLMVAGFVYIAIGLSYVLTTPTPTREIALHYALQVASLETWGLVFIVAGLLAILSSRWPPFAETWGYIVLTGLSAGWAAWYLVNILLYESPVANLSAVLQWGLTAFLWWAISGLINPNAIKRG